MRNKVHLLRHVERRTRSASLPARDAWAAALGTEGDPVAGRALTPAEAAEWLHERLGGRKRKPAAIRKLMRSGLGGIVLRSFHYGRELRTTEADLKRFVREIRAATQRPTSRRSQVDQSDVTSGSRIVDPSDEIAEVKSRFITERGAPHGSHEDSAGQIPLFAPAPQPFTRDSSH